ncbi:MAG: M28 family peptidase [Flavobacteriales bacterium]
MRYIHILVFLLLPSLLAIGQNAAPAVAITLVDVDEGGGTVVVNYDLADNENDACTVRLEASLDGGSTFVADVSQVSGDVGAAIAPGTGKSITWSFGAIANIYEATVRVIADDGHTPDIQAMVDQVTEARMSNLLTDVAIPRHHLTAVAGLDAIRDTLLNAFTSAGFEVSTQSVSHAGGTMPNVIGRQTGLENAAHTYIVDAHYDAVSSTMGADDNASGVVATLEVARILSQYRFRNSLRYIGFSFEEYGMIGSGQYVQSGIPAWETIAGVLNMEMIGFYSDAPNSQTLPAGFNILFPDAVAAIEADDFRGNFLTVVGNTASAPLNASFVSAVDNYVPDLLRIPLSVPGNGQLASDLRRSDHSRFWDAGIPALMLTDASEFRNPNYHTPNDIPSTLDIPFLTRCTKAVLAAAAVLAEPLNAGVDSYDLSQLVGITERSHALPCKVEVNPNPSNEVLRIVLGDCAGVQVSARLFDMRGKKVAGRDLYAKGDGSTFELPVKDLPAGTYLLVLQAGEGGTTVKVEVAH